MLRIPPFRDLLRRLSRNDLSLLYDEKKLRLSVFTYAFYRYSESEDTKVLPTREAKERGTMALSHALDPALAALFATSVGYMIPFIESQLTNTYSSVPSSQRPEEHSRQRWM